MNNEEINMQTAQTSAPASAITAAENGLWIALPGILWVILVFAALLAFRKELRLLVQALAWRVRSGAAVKLFAMELGEAYVSSGIDSSRDESQVPYRIDKDGLRWEERERYYQPNRNIHLVHRIAPSDLPGMLYDIELYIVPHRGATLAALDHVEYYFGRHWRNKVFIVNDRARSFRITTSAFGAFMCTAELVFTDGERVMVNRYVDFEMGAIGLPQAPTQRANDSAKATIV
jgi:hypothetical protein